MTNRRFLVPVLLIATALLASGTVRAENAAEAGGGATWFLPVLKLAAVSNSFAQDFDAATKTIPPHVWQVVLDAGWRVSLAENVVDAAPALRGISPRGWPAGLMWDNTDAVHLPTAKLLIIAEKRRNKKGQIVRCTRVGGVLRHEVGHAYDVVSGQPEKFQSAKPAFLDAYYADSAEMNSQRRTELNYYVQQGQAGHQETFAEAFGIVFGGGSDAAHHQAFVAAFPRTIDSVRRTVGVASRRAAKAMIPQPESTASD
jgi:hypothetical protein